MISLKKVAETLNVHAKFAFVKIVHAGAVAERLNLICFNNNFKAAQMSGLFYRKL